jgi:hypothetical protein
LVQQQNLALMEKATPMTVKVINDWKFSSRPVLHETKVLMVIIGSHNSKVVFNVISSLTTLSSLSYHGSFCIILEWIRE